MSCLKEQMFSLLGRAAYPSAALTDTGNLQPPNCASEQTRTERSALTAAPPPPSPPSLSPPRRLSTRLGPRVMRRKPVSGVFDIAAAWRTLGDAQTQLEAIRRTNQTRYWNLN